MEENKKSSMDRTLMGVFARTFRQHRVQMTIATIVMLLGALLLQLSFHDAAGATLSERIVALLTARNLGMAMMGTGVVVCYYYFIRTAFKSKSRSFSDIDEERKAKSQFYGGGEAQELVSELRSELHALRQTGGIDAGKLEEMIKKTLPKDDRSKKSVSGFDDYFSSVITNLSSRALDSDEKASLLLERGISYVKFGLWFYFLAIVAWQTLIHFWGFKTEYAYGIATTSLLFLFVEFLSAWFLKQYRHFVDTATYLLKVKAIFDRYYLIYLALKGGETHLSGDAKKLETLTSALTEDIKWPSDSHLTKADVAFAREALDSVSDLLKALKSSRKEKKDKADE